MSIFIKIRPMHPSCSDRQTDITVAFCNFEKAVKKKEKYTDINQPKNFKPKMRKHHLRSSVIWPAVL